MKEITVFSNGDSNKISTWSNVPYFFTKSLEEKGIKVNRIDINPSRLINKLYDITIFKLIKLTHPDTTYTYFRSKIHFLDVRRRIKKTIKSYGNSDANIFLTFSFSSCGLSKNLSVQLCDWTYDHYFNYFKEREPDYFERSSIKREESQIEGSNLIFSLFPNVANYMRKRYKNNEVKYNGNVINSLHEGNESEILERKKNHMIYFLLEVVNILKERSI